MRDLGRDSEFIGHGLGTAGRLIPVTLAAKLLGLSPQKAHAAARAGRFGPVLKGERHGTRGPCETLVISTRGVELASGILLTEQALEWASDCPDGQFPILAEAIGGSNLWTSMGSRV